MSADEQLTSPDELRRERPPPPPRRLPPPPPQPPLRRLPLPPPLRASLAASSGGSSRPDARNTPPQASRGGGASARATRPAREPARGMRPRTRRARRGGRPDPPCRSAPRAPPRPSASRAPGGPTRLEAPPCSKAPSSPRRGLFPTLVWRLFEHPSSMSRQRIGGRGAIGERARSDGIACAARAGRRPPHQLTRREGGHRTRGSE